MNFFPKKGFVGRYFLRHSFFYRVALLATGTAVGQVIILLCSPLLTRLYDPAEFGILAVFTAITGILGGIACLRYELAIPLCDDDRQAAAILNVANLTCLMMVLLTSVTVALFGLEFSNLLNLPEIAAYLWLVPVTILAVGIQTSANHWAIRNNRIQLMARSQLVLAIGRVTPQLALGLLGIGAFGLLIGQASGFALSGIFLWVSWKIAGTSPPIIENFRQAWQLAGRFRRFVLYSSPSTLLNGITRLTPAIFLAVLYGTEVAGWYGFAQLVIGAPVQLMAISVAQVYLSEAPRLRPDHGAQLHSLFLNTSGKLFAVGVIFLGVMAFLSPWIFAVIFGDAWEESGYIVRILAVLHLARFVVVPISQTLNMFERQDLIFIWDFLNIFILLSSFGAGYLLNLSYSITILIYSISIAFSYFIHFLMAFYVINKNRFP